MPIKIPMLVLTTVLHAQASSLGESGGRVIIRTDYEYATIVVLGADEPRSRATAQARDGRSMAVRLINEPNQRRIDIPLVAGVEPDARIRVDVVLPRGSSHVDILVPRGTIDVAGLSGRLTLETSSGSIRAREVQDLQLRTKSANVVLERVKGSVTAHIGAGNLDLSGAQGPVDVTASAGTVTATAVSSDVHVVSINGRTTLACVDGRIDVSDTSGAITIASAGDDVRVETATGRASLTTRVNPDARYVLKTLDGRLEVRVPPDSRDFVATISAYLKKVSFEPPFATAVLTPDADDRRRVLRVGAERARIAIEAFGGQVTFGPGTPKPCGVGGVSR